MKIYFAGSISGGRADKDIYLEIIKKLSKYGQVLTEHVGTVGEGGETEKLHKDIYERDIGWIRAASCIVAEVTQPSFGVGYELGFVENKKPVLCLFRLGVGKNLSPMISGNKSFLVKEYKELSDLDEILDNFFKML